MNAICQNSALTTVGNILNFVTCLLAKSVVPLLFAVAVVAFIWGVIQLVINPDNEEKRKQGKQYMIWGIIGFFVMISIWGLVEVLTETFGLKTFIPQLSQ